MFDFVMCIPYFDKNLKDQWLLRVCGEGGMKRWHTEDGEGSETTLIDTTVVDTHHYKFVQTDRMYNIKE